MASFELYVVENSVEAQNTVAPAEFSHDGNICRSCGDIVGFAIGKFFSCVVVVDEDENYWFVCSDCASPVVDY